MGTDQAIAVVETDQAAIVAAQTALDDLQVIALILCRQRWSIELAERYQEDLQIVGTGLSAARRQLTALRSFVAARRRKSSGQR